MSSSDNPPWWLSPEAIRSQWGREELERMKQQREDARKEALEALGVETSGVERNYLCHVCGRSWSTTSLITPDIGSPCPTCGTDCGPDHTYIISTIEPEDD